MKMDKKIEEKGTKMNNLLDDHRLSNKDESKA
jgi:hypothetical protein